MKIKAVYSAVYSFDNIYIDTIIVTSSGILRFNKEFWKAGSQTSRQLVSNWVWNMEEQMLEFSWTVDRIIRVAPIWINPE